MNVGNNIVFKFLINNFMVAKEALLNLIETTTTTLADTSTLRLRTTSTSVRSEKKKMVRRSATMTSQRLRRSSISLARNIGSGLYSLKETLMTSSMQDISEGSNLGQASTFYVTDSEDMTED